MKKYKIINKSGTISLEIEDKLINCSEELQKVLLKSKKLEIDEDDFDLELKDCEECMEIAGLPSDKEKDEEHAQPIKELVKSRRKFVSSSYPVTTIDPSYFTAADLNFIKTI